MKIPKKFFTVASAVATAMLFSNAVHAQVALTDIGAIAPTPGADDISQPTWNSTPGAVPPGLNYYWDNGANNGAFMGQSFTTGSNPQGYTMTSLAVQTGGNGGGSQFVSQSFSLVIYQLSGTGLTNATLLNTFTATSALIAEQDWLQWTGLGVSLQPNTTYAYGFGRSSGTTGNWEELANSTSELYSGGQVCSIPTAGGKINYSTTTGYDAVFDIGLILPAAPIPNPPNETPAYGAGGILTGTSVTLGATAAGSTPIGYQWQTDGGTGGSLTNIPGATGTNFVVNTTGFAVGTYQYDFVASNSLGTAVSPTIAINIAAVAMVDIGTNNPTPGPEDIAQLESGSQADDGINYYTDDGAGHGNWCGQTFTTGSNVNGYLLQTLAWKSAGNGSSFGNYQLYNLYFYSISDSTNATFIASYQGYGGGVENDWFQWQGLSVPLAPNSVYGYTLGRDATSAGWEHIATQGGNPYAGGEIMTIANANTNGGPVTYGPTGTSDAVFDLGLVVSQKPAASTPLYTPKITPIYAGTPITLSETAIGTPPLSYQWITDNGTGGSFVNVSGQTSTTYALNTSSLTAGTYRYQVIVSNNSGSSTSAPVSLNILGASAPIIVSDISPAPANQGYVGQTLTFSSTFTGTLPISYQWYVNKGTGATAISPANNPSAISNKLILSNLQLTDAGAYSVTAQNSQGSTPSSTSSLTVLTPPGPPAAGTLGASVLSDNPVAYWRLNETSDPSTGILPAYDASGYNFDGVYGAACLNGFNGYQGPQPPSFPGFEADNTAIFTQLGTTNSWVTVPSLNLNTNAVTITMWINSGGLTPTYGGLLVNRNGADAAGFGFGGGLNDAGSAELGYWWNTNSASAYNFNSGLYPPVGQWSFVALVVQSNQATIYLYYIDPNTGEPSLNSAANPISHSVEAFSGGATTIGTDPGNLVASVFDGSIDDVAVFNASLTSDQILALFSKGTGLTGPIAVSISGQPQSAATYVGNNVKLAATGINGSSPITYQWQVGGVNVTDGGNISGSQTPTLAFTSAATANSGTYKLLATNPAGTTTSSNATLTVVAPVPNSYESVVASMNPFAFWKLNEMDDPSVGGVPAFDYVGGHTGTYQTAAQNGFNAVVGPEAPAFPGFPSSYTALGTVENSLNSYVSASAGSLIASNLTYAMWIKPSGPVENWAGLLMDRGGVGAGFGFGGTVDGTGMSELGYTWNQNSSWSWNSNLFPPANVWSFVVMVIEPSKATIYLMNSNGSQSAVNAVAEDSEAFGSAWHIGNDAADGGNGGRTFPGSISDVSVFLTALSAGQVTALYNAGLGIIGPTYVTLHATPAGAGQLTLTWSQGTLQQAPSLTGPWTSTSLTSGSTITTSNSMMFYRVHP